MKVVLLLQDTRSRYGAEQATLNLASGLTAAGVDLRVLLLRETRLGGGSSPLAEAFRQVAPVEEIPVTGRLSREAIAQIRAIIAREGADLLHSTGYKADWHGGLASRRGAFFPVVSTVHGWLFRRRPKELAFQALNVRILRDFNRVIVLCGFYEEYLKRRGFIPLQLARIPTGVRADRLAEEREAWRLWDDAGAVFTFGMLGRLSSEKNHALLLRAAARTAREMATCPRSWRILVAGEGPLRGRLERLARRLGIADRVEWAGWMEPAAFFRQTHALVQCSRVENQPLSVLEAMAWMRPVIATQAGGLPELVTEGDNGWLTERNSARDLARALRECLTAPEKARDAGARGRQRLEREHEFGRMIEDHIGLYEAERHSWRGRG